MRQGKLRFLWISITRNHLIFTACQNTVVGIASPRNCQCGLDWDDRNFKKNVWEMTELIQVLISWLNICEDLLTTYSGIIIFWYHIYTMDLINYNDVKVLKFVAHLCLKLVNPHVIYCWHGWITLYSWHWLLLSKISGSSLDVFYKSNIPVK